MKFCVKCGTQLNDDVKFCVNCGAGTDSAAAPEAPVAAAPVAAAPVAPVAPAQTSGLTTAAKVFMILGTVIMGFYLIPLAWCLPLTITYCKKVRENQPISTGFKVCCLLFVSLLGGIFMLCDKEH